ncbi:MAG: hypothetical protein ACRERE_20150 [Candidatus Entotheonellia bacterium]
MLERPMKSLVLLATVLGLIAFTGVLAAEPASPAVEVKFFLNPPTVLDANDRLNHALRKAFQVVKEPVTIRMQFLDGPGRELHQEEWNIRFRKLQGNDHVELTFKRRYPVDGPLEAALATAAREGFDAAEHEYEPELEWGYQKQTLTFANEKQAGDAELQNLNLPSAVDARHLAAGDKMPDKLRHWKEEGWAHRILSGARVYGPVEGRRWRGRHAKIDDKINIEVWALPTANGTGTQPIVEISFKKKEYDADAMAQREKLRQFLKQKGWLLEKDELKTALILERSGHPNR